MALALVLLFGILHILILLPQCMCHNQAMATGSLIQPQLNSHGVVQKHNLTKETNFLATSTRKVGTITFHSRRQTARNLSSRHRRIARRGIFPDISNFASNTFGGFFGNSNNQANGLAPQSGSAIPNSRQVTYPQDSQPFPSGDSRALMNGQPNAPLPHPTQLPNSAGGSSKSPSPSTTTPTSLRSQATPVSSHSPSSATAVSASAASAAPTVEPAPLSALQRFVALYKPTNRFEPLAVLLTIVFILAFLVTLMSILKCVAHKKRFANKKDYPTGFPWVEPAGSKTNRTSSRQGLVSTPSYMSNRNSMTSSVYFSSGRQLGPESEMTPHQAEYQLNELGSDVYANYAWAVTEMDLEKNLSSPSDEGPSSATTEEGNHTPNQQHDRWHTQSLNGDPGFIRGGKGELLEDSKVFKLDHP